MTANDPRVSGAVTGTWNSDRWGSQFDGALVQWGTAVLSNEGGSWEVPYAGVYTSESGGYISRWYVGKDGYDVLTFMWISDPRTFAWQGLIMKVTLRHTSKAVPPGTRLDCRMCREKAPAAKTSLDLYTTGVAEHHGCDDRGRQRAHLPLCGRG